jgi:hypothetical protein
LAGQVKLGTGFLIAAATAGRAAFDAVFGSEVGWVEPQFGVE